MTRCRITERYLSQPAISPELREHVRAQAKMIGGLETKLGTAERTIRNQQVVIDRLKRSIAELQSKVAA